MDPSSSKNERATVMAERVQALRLPAPSKGATNNRLPWAVCVALSGLVAWQAYAFRNQPPPLAVAEQSSSPATSSQAASSPANGADVVLEDKGYVIPVHQILVSPQVSGKILELSVVEGEKVREGTVLAKLDDVEYVADRDRAAALLKRANATLQRAKARHAEAVSGFRPLELQQAEADYFEAEIELERLQSEHDRNADLKAKKSLTDLDFDQSEARFQTAQQRVRRLKAAHELMRLGERDERKDIALHEVTQAEADVQQAQADLVKAEWRLKNCTIVAPIDGTILKKNAEKGNIVNPVAFNGSFSLCEMADLSELEVELSIGERDIHEIFPGQRCEVRGDAYKDRVYSGIVDRLMPIADRAKASVPVRVKVRVPAGEEGVYLKPEMGVTVTFFKRDTAAPEAATSK